MEFTSAPTPDTRLPAARETDGGPVDPTNGPALRVAQLLGHTDGRTTMAYTHVGYGGPASARSPLDRLE